MWYDRTKQSIITQYGRQKVIIPFCLGVKLHICKWKGNKFPSFCTAWWESREVGSNTSSPAAGPAPR